MKNTLFIIMILFVTACSSSIPDQIEPADTPITRAYSKISGDDFVGTWDYYINKSDDKPYEKIIITKDGNDYLINVEIFAGGQWIKHWHYEPQKLTNYISYQQATGFRKQPNFTLTDNFNNKVILYYKVESNSQYLELKGNKFYRAK